MSTEGNGRAVDTADVIAMEAAKLQAHTNAWKEKEVARQKPSYDIPDDHFVLVATPNYTNSYSTEAHTNHMKCAMLWREWNLKVKHIIIGRTFVHFARSQACRVAADGGFTHVFWIDDDAIVDPEILPRFLSHRKDVVIAPYPMRRSPFQIGILSATNYYCRDCKCRQSCGPDAVPVKTIACEKCGKDIPRDFHDHQSYRNLRLSDMDRGLLDVDGGGTHAMLVKVECLLKARGFLPPGKDEPLDPENRSYPEAAIEIFGKLKDVTDKLKDRELVDHYIGDLPDESRTFEEEDDNDKPYFAMPKAGTEDMLHCYRMKKKGIDIYCDTDVFCDHVGFAPFITKAFVAEMERTLKEIGAKKSPRPNRITVMPVEGEGRDHTRMDSTTPVSLM